LISISIVLHSLRVRKISIRFVKCCFDNLVILNYKCTPVYLLIIRCHVTRGLTAVTGRSGSMDGRAHRTHDGCRRTVAANTV